MSSLARCLLLAALALSACAAPDPNALELGEIVPLGIGTSPSKPVGRFTFRIDGSPDLAFIESAEAGEKKAELSENAVRLSVTTGRGDALFRWMGGAVAGSDETHDVHVTALNPSGATLLSLDLRRATIRSVSIPEFRSDSKDIVHVDVELASADAPSELGSFVAVDDPPPRLAWRADHFRFQSRRIPIDRVTGMRGLTWSAKSANVPAQPVILTSPVRSPWDQLRAKNEPFDAAINVQVDPLDIALISLEGARVVSIEEQPSAASAARFEINLSVGFGALR